METIKETVICILCFGIISSCLKFICPEEKYENYLKYIIGGIMIITIISGLSVFKGFSADTKNYDTENIEISSDEYYVRVAEENLSYTLENLLYKENISGEVYAEIDISDDNNIYISKVSAYVDKISDFEKAEQILRENLGEEVSIYVRERNDEND